MNRDDPKIPHRYHREEIGRWMSGAGLKQVQEFPDMFSGAKWFLIYGRK